MLARDGDLIQKAQQGDSAALNALWCRYEPQVTRFCHRYVAGPDHDPAFDAQDFAAETFIRAIHHLDQYASSPSHAAAFEIWLLEIAKNVCLRSLNTRQRRRRWTALPGKAELLETRPDRAAPSPERVVEEREVLRLAAQAIQALPDLYRTPFKLSLEERSLKEIATTVGISPESAAKRVQRARKWLQPALAEVLGVPLTAAGGARQ